MIEEREVKHFSPEMIRVMQLHNDIKQARGLFDLEKAFNSADYDLGTKEPNWGDRIALLMQVGMIIADPEEMATAFAVEIFIKANLAGTTLETDGMNGPEAKALLAIHRAKTPEDVSAAIRWGSKPVHAFDAVGLLVFTVINAEGVKEEHYLRACDAYLDLLTDMWERGTVVDMDPEGIKNAELN